MNSLSIYYRTAYNVPAPFSYEISFEFSEVNNNFGVDFQMEYSDRETLSESEIVEEGFSLNDNYSWKGTLNKVWKNEIDDLLAKTELRNLSKENEIILRNAEGEFAPKNFKDWSILIQDLIQAVFESSGKEKQWVLTVLVLKINERLNQKIEVSFANRKVEFSFGSHNNMDWPQAKKLMELIYLSNFEEDKASGNLPSKDGIYLCFDELTWYKLGYAITNPHGNKAHLNKLENAFLKLI
jgi:hypothetical protein